MFMDSNSNIVLFQFKVSAEAVEKAGVVKFAEGKDCYVNVLETNDPSWSREIAYVSDGCDPAGKDLGDFSGGKHHVPGNCIKWIIMPQLSQLMSAAGLAA